MIRFLLVNGLKMAFWAAGPERHADQKTLVFIHGSGGDHTAWRHQCEAFAHAANTVACDLPGHGLSEGSGEQEIAAYAAWVRRILQAMAVRKPVLIGHSLGAAIALHYALAHGDEVAGIVSVGGGAAMPVNPLILQGLKTDPATVIAMAAKIALAKSNRDRLADTLTESMARVHPDILHGDFLACSRHDLTASVSRIRVPVLAVCGREDKMTPPDLSRYLGEHIPGAQLALIENAGHFVMLENVQAFNRALADFIESLP